MGLRALGGVRQIGYIVGSVLAPGSFREASTLKADQAGNTSNKTTKGGASRCGRWTVRTHRGEGDKLGADAVEGCRFEVQSRGRLLQAHLWQKAGREQLPAGFEGQAECSSPGGGRPV